MDGHCEDSEEEDLVVVGGLDEATGFAGEEHLAEEVLAEEDLVVARGSGLATNCVG